MNEFLMFVSDCDLAVPSSTDCEKRHLEQLFIAIDQGQREKEEYNNKRSLSRQEFMQMLVHIAVVRYMIPSKKGYPPIHTDVSRALAALLQEHLPRHLDPAALQLSNEFRVAYLYLPETDETLCRHGETLRNLFAVYADAGLPGAAGGKELNSATLLCFEEWLLLCGHLELLDYDFTMREATLCFMWSKMRIANESEAKERRKLHNMRFEDFLEAIVRLATMKCVPTDDEVEQGGFDDGGQMLLTLRSNPAEDYAFRSKRPAVWNMPLRQPIWRCVHHLICFFARIIELRVHGVNAYGNDLQLKRREVLAFKRHQTHGLDERGHEAMSVSAGGAKSTEQPLRHSCRPPSFRRVSRE